jgi:Transcription factor Iwr1
MLQDFFLKSGDATLDVNAQKKPMEPGDTIQKSGPRKRPVINRAERRWREMHKGSVATAKAHIASLYDRQPYSQSDHWEDDSEKLAQDFAKIALELNQKEKEIKSTKLLQAVEPSVSQVILPKPPLKYQPKLPPSRPWGTTREERMELQEELACKSQNAADPTFASDSRDTQLDRGNDSDGDYVYDTYVRQPLPASPIPTDPLPSTEVHSDTWYQSNCVDTTRTDIGIVVITQEDEQVWELFAEEEDDEDGWNSEDEDSNGKWSAIVCITLYHETASLASDSMLFFSYGYFQIQCLFFVKGNVSEPLSELAS